MRVRETPEPKDKQLSGTAGSQDLTSSDRESFRIVKDRIKNRTKVKTPSLSEVSLKRLGHTFF
jgi:hypothetical protein